MDALRGSIRLFQRLGQGVGRGGHAQHAPAVRDEPAVLDGRAGVVDRHIGGVQLARGQAGNLLALLVGEGIAAAG